MSESVIALVYHFRTSYRTTLIADFPRRYHLYPTLLAIMLLHRFYIALSGGVCAFFFWCAGHVYLIMMTLYVSYMVILIAYLVIPMAVMSGLWEKMRSP